LEKRSAAMPGEMDDVTNALIALQNASQEIENAQTEAALNDAIRAV
jgi:hypothetical protein